MLDDMISSHIYMCIEWAQHSVGATRHGIGSATATELELEVLKAVMAREAYLERLQRQSKGMTKRFQDEVADTFDLLRLASVEVVETVMAWREVVGPDAVFQWNSVNYLLKMRSEEHTSELQSLMRISYAVFCLKKKKLETHNHRNVN